MGERPEGCTGPAQQGGETNAVYVRCPVASLVPGIDCYDNNERNV